MKLTSEEAQVILEALFGVAELTNPDQKALYNSGVAKLRIMADPNP